MDLEALTYFALVAAHGGFARASRASGRPKATLSRRVTELEQELGVRLIERGTQTLRLTDEGRALYERTRGPLSEIAEVEEVVRLGASTPQGRLRVSVPVLLAHVAFGKISAQFALAYPEVALELVAEDRKVDPVEDGYDLVIRVDPSSDERLVGRRILDDQRLVVAAPTFTKPHREVDANDVPSVKAVLMPRLPADTVWRFLPEQGDTLAIRVMPALRLSSLALIREAVLAGVGVSLLPRLLVEGDIAAGHLVSWGVHAEPAVQIWALRNSRRLVGAKVRAFLEMVEQAFPARVYNADR